MTLNIEELISYYTGGEPDLPPEVQRIVEWTREAANNGRALEVVSRLRRLCQFEGATNDGNEQKVAL